MHPLSGIRVLDLSNVLAGPFCCHQLAHLGAEVIKVEVPGRGDLARQLGADQTLNHKFMGVSFLAQNAGKQSITLNLKNPKGAALLKKLVLSADVLVENFRPGVMERLKLGWDVLREINPRLIYCAISGFGQDGPWRDLPAYDQIIQGVSGVMSITGDSDTAPYRVGYPISDTIGGLTAAFAISAALQGRDSNSSTSEGGSFIDVSMLEATMATMGWVLSNWLIAGQHPSANGNENFTSAPSGTFLTADAPLNIAANKQEQWESLCRLLAREDLLRNSDFISRELRKKNRAALKLELEKTLKTRPAKDWAAELNRLGVPAGRVLDVPEVLEQPQISERGMIGAFADVPGAERDIQVMRTGIKLDGKAPAVKSPPPQLGEHNYEVYGALGLSTEEIDKLVKEKVL
ncbi:CaiB/BaiF CoA-transferase family protein [Pelagibius sp. Alg239-R121]|uniref:CaiB/BaiF CoA transferase family protein n=1 Tax=Pelagibius sp. Alg239-R121 TaxID=2993448 RepID=UPI0024A67C92|nr:CoA transferase [Pelagibius sp. Alg239-R121]